jgi:DNA-binding response OmpR family regulator
MPTSQLRILCIDDDEDTSELINVILKRSNADYQIKSVKTPEEALKLAATREFDLYVLDYRFPGMTGVEVCKKIRQADANTPIMFFTGEARERERQEALDACADAYLIKPIDLDKLADTARQLLTARRPALDI